LSSAVTVDALTPVPLGDPLVPKVYKVWVPEGAMTVSITLTPTATPQCDDLNVGLSMTGAPCEQYYDDYAYPCSQLPTFTDAANDDPAFFYADPSTSGWIVDAYWYISVGRSDSFDATTPCGYSLNVTITNCSVAGQVATYLNAPVCFTYSDIVADAPTQVNISAIFPSIFVFPTAINTDYYNITVTSTDSELIIVGAYGAAPTEDNYAPNCFAEDGNDDGNGKFIYTLQCLYPLQTYNFYFLIVTDDDTASKATVTLTPKVCATGTAGPNCQFAAYNLSDAASLPAQYQVINGDATRQYIYFYADAPAQQGLPDFNVSFTITSGGDPSAYLYWGPNQFDDSSNYGLFQENSELAYYVTNYETYPGGRFFIMMSGEADTFNFTLTGSAPASSTGSTDVTGGVSTASNTGSNTGATNTGSNTGSVSTNGGSSGTDNNSSGVATLAASAVVVMVSVVALML